MTNGGKSPETQKYTFNQKGLLSPFFIIYLVQIPELLQALA